ncbi:MAG: acyl carrier protein [Gammaproteobacteria bacterium]
MNDQTLPERDTLQYFDDVARIVRQTLQLDDSKTLEVDTALLGDIPEFDSMSVVTVLVALEEQFGFYVDDDDVSAETFETVGTLLRFVQEKVVDG